MLEYVVESNVDTRILKRAAEILAQGGLVAYPTDTSWSLACSILSREGLDKLKALKGPHSFIPSLVCSDLSQVSNFVLVDNWAFRYMKPLVPGPFVFIFEPLSHIDKKTGMKRLELGVRIPDHNVPRRIVETLGQPLFSITASRQMTQEGWWDVEFAEENLFEYGYELEEIPGIGLILDTGEPLTKDLATVIDMKQEGGQVIRQGIGIC